MRRVLASCLALLLGAACGPDAPGGVVADSSPTTPDARIDSGPIIDAGPIDVARPDVSTIVGICQPCEWDPDCGPDAVCVPTGLGPLCLPRCSADMQDCPDGFLCAGIKSTYCAPFDGICCLDSDDDGWGDGIACYGPDCDDNDPARNPGLLDICDGIDNDCDPGTDDGEADPAVGAPCDGPDSDHCEEGIATCAGSLLVCSDMSGDNAELCNGVDDDCISLTIDGSGDPAVGVPCDGPDGDLCEEGASSCSAGMVVCSDASTTTIDYCNGVDEDCNPATADGADDPAVGAACDGPDTDLCEEGTRACSGGVVTCSDTTGSTTELCNGLDDDCNPSTTDGSNDPGVGVPCDGGDGDLCLEGASSCTGGAIVCGDATTTTLDVCNGIDDDCDPTTPDGSDDPSVGAACDGPDTDLCEEGVRSCVGGSLVCSDSSGNNVELCNGIDDDCNGSTADGSSDPDVGVACDGPDGDLCLEGASSCTGGSIVCGDATTTTLDVCNGLDDDCNAATADGADDGAVGAACDGLDTDLCQEGTVVCIGGGLVCNDVTGNSVETCNGIDDDCNASTADGSGDPSVGLVCDGPDGDRCNEGVTSCVMGSVSCSDATGTTVDLCNGVDDDCDSTTSDGSSDPAVGAPCDGADGDLCQEGTFSCVSGALACSDTTTTTIDVCNGLDDDCDLGSADGSEDSGVGAICDGPDTDVCPEGVTVCSSGSIVCSDATANDVELCNGVDDDCDLAIDEDFDLASDPFNCGICGNTCGSLCCGGTCTAASATNCGACGQVCAPGMLVVTELQIDPSAVADGLGEWLEIYNPNAWGIDLRGFVLRDLGTDTHTITSSQPVIIPALEYVVLGINANTATNGGVTLAYQYASFDLGNAGDEVRIQAFGVIIDDVIWPSTFDVSGRSKELSRNHNTAAQNDTLANWCTATSIYGAGDRGTPGAQNVCALP